MLKCLATAGMTFVHCALLFTTTTPGSEGASQLRSSLDQACDIYSEQLVGIGVAKLFLCEHSRPGNCLPLMYMPLSFAVAPGDAHEFSRMLETSYTESVARLKQGRQPDCTSLDVINMEWKPLIYSVDADAKLRLSLVVLLSEITNGWLADNVIFARLLDDCALRPKQVVRRAFVGTELGDDGFFQTLDLADLLGLPALDIHQLRTFAKSVRRAKASIPFVLARGSEQTMPKSCVCYTDVIVDSDVAFSSEYQLFEMMRNDTIITYPRYLRATGLIRVFDSARQMVERLNAKEREELYQIIQPDMELALSRMLRCDSVLEVLMARARYVDFVRHCDLPLTDDKAVKSEEWTMMLPLIEEIVNNSQEGTQAERDNARGCNDRYSCLSKINEIASLWEDRLLKELHPSPKSR